MTIQVDHIALLRGVNVAGNRKVAMKDLVALAVTLGLKEARTLLQSGNLVFRGSGAATEKMEEQFEKRALKDLGLKTTFMIRTAEEWLSVVKANPFKSEAKSDPGHLVLLTLKDAPTKSAVTALRSAIKGPELIELRGRHLYATYPDGIGRSKLTSALIDGKLGTIATGRNWNTVLKLAALVGDHDA